MMIPVSSICQPKLHQGGKALMNHAHPLEEQDLGGFVILHGDVEM